MMASLFILFIIEMWMNNKMGGHSHGGARGFEHAPPPMAPMAAPQRPERNPDRNSFEADDISYEKKMAYEEKEYPYPAGSELDLPQSEMPPWFVVFYEQYVRQRLELVNMIRANGNAQPRSSLSPGLSRKSLSVRRA